MIKNQLTFVTDPIIIIIKLKLLTPLKSDANDESEITSVSFPGERQKVKITTTSKVN
jgi:hypothetical protein